MPESAAEKSKIKLEQSGSKRSAADQQQQQQQLQPKKKKRPPPEFRDIPTPAHYQISFMHRTVVTHVITSWKHAYVVTASADGIVKFWKRTEVVPPESKEENKMKQKEETTTPCLEFVKSFTAHVGAVAALVMEDTQADVCVSIGHNDGIIKVYEVSTFDATAMIKTKEPVGSPHASFFRTAATRALFLAVASSQRQDGRIFIFSVDSVNMGLVQTIQLHATANITSMTYNAPNHCMYTADSKGILEVWDCSGNSSKNDNNNNGSNAITNDGSRPEEDDDDDDAGEENNNEDDEINTMQIGGPCTAKTHGIAYTSKLDTQLYELVKKKTHAIAMCVLPKTGSHVFVYSADNRIRIFHHATGSIVVKYDERLTVYDKSFAKYNMDAMDYGKRAATEREMMGTSIWSGITPTTPASSANNNSPMLQRLTLQVDPSGKYLLIPTLLGLKVIDWQRNKLIKIIGKSDASQLRFVSFCLCWGNAKINRQMQLARGAAAISSAAKEKSRNSGEDKIESDALVIALAYEKRRFFSFSHLDPVKIAEGEDQDGQDDPASRRDQWNEPPTAEDRLGMRGNEMGGNFQNEAARKMGSTAILRTSMGDVHIKLFTAEVPRTLENFCGHAKAGYYDNVIFHRIIKGFMLQTGDPLGDGTGGESLWGGEFEDEFVRDLRHDRPFTVSMANAGPNTNGSQFFITTVPTPWLDNKHTVFGRVTKGMDICTLIENAKTDDGDKPFDDIRILSVDIE